MAPLILRPTTLPLLALLLTSACIPAPDRPEQKRPAPTRNDKRPVAKKQVPPVAKPDKAVEQPPLPGPPPPPVSENAAPSPPPAWQIKAVSPSVVEVTASTYVVRSGDTLRGISDKTGAASEAIARINKIPAPFKILVGQKLKIPGGRYHKVGKAETGIAIARAYGVDWVRIAQLNELEEPYILREGQRLQLPSRKEVADMSPNDRSAAFRLDIEDLISGSEPALATRETPSAPVLTPRPVAPTATIAEPSRFAGRFDWPVRGPVLRGFGRYSSGQINQGINIGAPRGTSIAAAADGVVAYVGQDIPAYGTLILVRHGDGWISAYGYADSITVTRGQKVVRGQTIAKSGASPYSGEPQLHFEIRNGLKPVNPTSYLPSRS
ncbi:MAG: peptidoglycan DD-metalloendopeptidase family protein [Pseudomonadota bacterium]